MIDPKELEQAVVLRRRGWLDFMRKSARCGHYRDAWEAQIRLAELDEMFQHRIDTTEDR